MEIKINLEIGLSPALENFLGKLLGEQARPAPKPLHTPEQIAEAEEAMADQPSPQPEAQRRTRRTKAQIEADNAAAASPATSTDAESNTSSGSQADQTDGGSEETLTEALGIDEGDYTVKDVKDAVTAAVERTNKANISGNVLLIQETLLKVAGTKAVGSSFPLDKAAATIDALNALGA